MNKKTIAILFGGTNSEHDVSLMSSTSVLNNIDREKYDIVCIGITKDGRWMLYSGDISDIKNGEWENNPANTPAIISPDRKTHGILYAQEGVLKEIYIDVAFPVMHGKFAEDGSMQGLFELAGIAYVGPGVTASANCMDKEYMHIILDSVGVKTSKFICIRESEKPDMLTLLQRIDKELGGYPVFVKPANAGSSVGVSKVKTPEDLHSAMALAFENDHKLLIEAENVGKEVECAVMGNENPISSNHLGEVVPEIEFYDYNSKYYDDTAKLYLPARITDEENELVRQTAIKAYKTLDCRGLARIDFFLLADGTCVLNEPNTLPGFTHISMYPKLFADSGVSYPQLIDKLIDYALQAQTKE